MEESTPAVEGNLSELKRVKEKLLGVYVSLKDRKQTRSRSQAKVVRYYHDGTGRDVYVG
jgi:hypothetical protein